MASRKVYFEQGQPDELEININDKGQLYVQLSEENGFPLQNILLSVESTKEVMADLIKDFNNVMPRKE